MVRAIFFDLDGTLISGTTGTYSPAVKEALDALHEKGILLFAATGRAPYELHITNMIQGLPFDAVITLNGQYCYAGQQTLYCHTFDKGDLARVLSLLEEHPFPCAFIEREAMYLNYIDELVLQVQSSIHTPSPPVRKLDNILQREVLMIMPYLAQRKAAQLLEPVLKNSTTTRWSEYCADVIPKHCSKRSGIQELMAHYNLCWDEIMAFGDGDNDFEMLQSAKYGIAMKNSSQLLLDGGFHVTGHVDEDGVVTALRQFHIL